MFSPYTSVEITNIISQNGNKWILFSFLRKYIFPTYPLILPELLLLFLPHNPYCSSHHYLIKDDIITTKINNHAI